MIPAKYVSVANGEALCPETAIEVWDPIVRFRWVILRDRIPILQEKQPWRSDAFFHGGVGRPGRGLGG